MRVGKTSELDALTDREMRVVFKFTLHTDRHRADCVSTALLDHRASKY